MARIFLTSESVTEGHPDKVCDQISDAILDAYLAQDESARVAVECMISNRLLVIAGEVTAKADVDIEKVARNTILSIGYDRMETGFDGKTCLVIQNIVEQSPDIASGVDTALECRNGRDDEQQEELGAGDQGIMHGYACTESDDFMPLPIYFSHKLAERLAYVRKQSLVDYLYPDGKTQVTLEYTESREPVRISSIVVSAQHKDTVTREQIQKDVLRHVIKPVIPAEWWHDDIKILINPSGRFVIGGPLGDTGLTGRKIMVDTYGGMACHGGGAFSGKDPTKLDRAGAYMTRYVSKNIVAAGLAERCHITLSYAIGVATPTSVSIDTYGTEMIPLPVLQTIVENLFDFTPKGIMTQLRLKKAVYGRTSAYGHFKSGANLPWEETDRVADLHKVVEAVKPLYQKRA